MEINHIGTKKIYTNRLILRKFNENDTKEIFENWISDPEVSKYMVWNSHKNVEETERWLQKCIYKYQNQDVYNWGIELKENGILIGSISANKSDIDEECYEIGYAFGKRFWGNGCRFRCFIQTKNKIRLTVILQRGAVCGLMNFRRRSTID